MALRVHTLSLGTAPAYLIEGQAGLWLVDAGSPRHEQRVLRQMRTLGREDLRLIFITHAHLDHYGSAAALRRLTGAPIAVHRADATAMADGETRLGQVRGRGRWMRVLLPLVSLYLQPEPTEADLLLDDGDDLRAFGLEAVVLHTPGHPPGSSCLLVERRLAFAGDLISANGRPHAQCFFADDWPLVARSLARLQAVAPAWVYAGHGSRPVSGQVLQSLTLRSA